MSVTLSLDEVRAQLRRRGYLGGGLSLWIAAGRGGPASRLRRAVAAGVRVGLVGGPALALPATASIALSSGPELTARGVLQIWLVLSLLMGAALGALECGADLTLAWLARRGVILLGRAERLAGRVGLLFAGAATLYLLLYARGGRLAGAQAVSAGLPAWLRWGAVLLAALAAGHVVGRMIRLRSLVILATSLAGMPAPGAAGRRRRWAVLAGWGVAAAAGVALVFLPPRAPEELPAAEADVPGIVAAPVPGRVLLLGVDGLDADLLARAAAGRLLPSFARLLGEAARYRLASSEPPAPPVRWTTIATGRPASQHGVIGYQAGRLPGVSIPVQEPAVPAKWHISPGLLLPPRATSSGPVSSRERRALAVWEILGAHGVRVAALNWWATWPAPAHGAPEALVVSERAFPRLESGRPPDRDVAPAQLQDSLRGRFAEDLRAVRSRLVEAGISGAGPVATAARADAWHARVGLRLWSEGGARVVLVYLSALDIARRAQPEGVDAVLAAIEPVIGEAMAQAAPEDLLLVVGDPGRSARGGGVLLAWGGRVAGIGTTGSTGEARLEDLAPTLLALSGLPPAADLPGRAVLDFLAESDPARRPLAPVPGYGPGAIVQEDEIDDPFDEELLDRLRSLGYIH